MSDRKALTVASVEAPKPVGARMTLMYKFKATDGQTYATFDSKIASYIKVGAVLDVEVETKTTEKNGSTYTNHNIVGIHADTQAPATMPVVPLPTTPVPASNNRWDPAIQLEIAKLNSESIERQVKAKIEGENLRTVLTEFGQNHRAGKLSITQTGAYFVKLFEIIGIKITEADAKPQKEKAGA